MLIYYLPYLSRIIRTMSTDKNKDQVEIIKPQSVKKNFGYQTLYQIFILVIPFITAPFMTRRLGATSLGNYTYANSIASYFCLFAALGITSYGIRSIASARNDTLQLRKTFWSLYLVHSFTSLISLSAYCVFLVFVKEYSFIYYIESLFVLSNLFDITWLFTGLENFKNVVLKNLFVKIVTSILLLTLIHYPEDVYIYTWIQAGSALTSQLLLMPWALKHIKPIKVGLKDCIVHIKPMLILFVSSVATTLYTTFDKTLLGLMTTKEDVAYYNYADTIVAIPKAIIGAIITVLHPRVCALFALGKRDESKKYIRFSMEFVSLLGMGAMFGLLGIGQELAVIYFGASFSETGNMLLWMSPLPYIIMIGQIAIFEYMVPAKKDIWITINIVIAATLNIGLSAAFIHFMGPTGAILGTIIAESAVTVLNVISTRGFISFKKILRSLIPYGIIGAIMYGCLLLIQKYWESSTLQLVISILSGLVIYFVLSFVYIFTISKSKEENKQFIRNIFHRD
jgi:O-antigen/teichoic acid export membrane protein